MSPRPEADPHLGRTLVGQYRIDALLGYGGMGRVYRGMQLSVSRPVAIKLIAGAAPHPAEWVMRFRREAEATARLSHPNTVRLFDFGVTESQELFMVMELLEGTTLAQHLIPHAPLPLPTALAITRQVLLALCEAHALGITHRDIKPDNIFLAKAGADIVAKVMDFGIAGLSRSGGSGKLTGTGVVIGTPAYMSPEQAQGEPVDGKSDVYSLGVVLYEMISGRPVFESDTAVPLLLAHVARAPERLSARGIHLPEQTSLQALLDRLLAKRPGERPSATEALDTVTALSARLGVAAATGSLRAVPAATRSTSQTNTPSSRATLAKSTLVEAVSAHSLPASASATHPQRRSWHPFAFTLGAGVVIAAAATLALRSGPALLQVTRPAATETAVTPSIAAAPPQEPRQPRHKVVLRSRPSGASVYRDGDKLGVTPYELQLDAAAELSVAADGYERQLLQITPDTRSPLFVSLTPERPASPPERRPAPREQPAPAAPEPAAVADDDSAATTTEPPPAQHAPGILGFKLRPTTITSPPTAAPSPTAAPPVQRLPDESDAISGNETTRARPNDSQTLREDELTDVALDDDERSRVSSHHGLRVLGRALVQAVGKILIPYPDRPRREALARMPLLYPSFREARAAYQRNEIDATGFQESVWQLRERRRTRIQTERDRFARGELTQGQYENRLDRIWDDFWGRRQQ